MLLLICGIWFKVCLYQLWRCAVNQLNKKNQFNKNMVQPLASSLFVLSQIANKRKAEIAATKTKLEALDPDDLTTEQLSNKLKGLRKTQQYFHAERTQIIRFLIHRNMIPVLGYIEFDSYNYAVVKISEYKFYVILNKKMIEKFQIKKIGEELVQTELLSDEELDAIMSKSEAEKIFKLCLAKVRMNLDKTQTKVEKSGNCKNQEVSMLKTVTSNGSIVVVRKKKFAQHLPKACV